MTRQQFGQGDAMRKPLFPKLLGLLLALGLVQQGAAQSFEEHSVRDLSIRRGEGLWIGFGLVFTIYVLDCIAYLLIALCARCSERFYPQPGYPHYKYTDATPFALTHQSKDLAGAVARSGTPFTLAMSKQLAHVKSEYVVEKGSPEATSPIRTGLETAASSPMIGGTPRKRHVNNNPFLPTTSASSYTSSSSCMHSDATNSIISSSPRKADVTNKAAGADSNMPATPRKGGDSKADSKDKVDAKDVQLTITPQPAIQGVPPELLDVYGEGYPMCIIQLPMYNEDEHCERAVRDACKVAWPRDRLLIQVNDDSTKEDIKARVDAVAQEMREKGHMVQVTRRTDRIGYKAGNMVAGLKQIPKDLVAKPKYVAIFDADFQPPVDYLYQTIWHMEADPVLGFVQGRWRHANVVSLLTWAQAVCLDFHFSVEQRARSYLRTFFGFNGTAGVWRLEAMRAAGGWHADTTVEDMDLSIRAFAAGWKFKYLDHVGCYSELPSTMQAYKTQQYRWQSGPMQVVKKSMRNTWASDRIPITAKLGATWFFVRYYNNMMITVVSIIVPPMLLFYDAYSPWRLGWPQIFFLAASNAYTLVYVLFTPLGWPLYAIFGTCTGFYRMYCIAVGLIGSEKTKTWKVTEKVGAVKKVAAGSAAAAPQQPPSIKVTMVKGKGATADDDDDDDDASSNSSSAASSRGSPTSADGVARLTVAAPSAAVKPKRKKHKPYMLELTCSLYYIIFAFIAIKYQAWVLLAYCCIMAAMLIVMGFGDQLLSVD